MSNPGEVDRALSMLDEAVAAVAGLGVHPLELVALTLDDLDLDADTLRVGARSVALERAERDALLVWTQAGRVALLAYRRADMTWDGVESGYRRVRYKPTGTYSRYQRMGQPVALFYGADGEPLTIEAASEIAHRFEVELTPTPLRAVAS